MSHSGDSLCAPQPAARWKKQCYQKKTCGKPLCPPPNTPLLLRSLILGKFSLVLDVFLVMPRQLTVLKGWLEPPAEQPFPYPPPSCFDV